MCSCRRIAIPQLHKGDKHPFTLLSVQKCLPFFLTHEHLATAFANDSNISWICNGLTQSNSKSESKKSNWNFIKQHKRAGRCEVDGLWVDLLATVQFYPEQKCQTANCLQEGFAKQRFAPSYGWSSWSRYTSEPISWQKLQSVQMCGSNCPANTWKTKSSKLCWTPSAWISKA